MTDYKAIFCCVARQDVGEIEVAHKCNTETDFLLTVIRTGLTDNSIYDYLLSVFCQEAGFKYYDNELRPSFSVPFKVRRNKRLTPDNLPVRALRQGLDWVGRVVKDYHIAKLIKEAHNV